MEVEVIDLAAALGGCSPDAVELAELCSIASRLEPELLRAMRIRLLSDADAGAEADLWFSELVGFRNATAITLRPEARRHLRDKLASNSGRMAAAWAVTRDMHAYLPAAIQAEEELVWLTLSKQMPLVQERLRSAVIALIDPERPGMAEWAIRALDQFPEATRDEEEARMLALAASLRVQDSPAGLTESIEPARLQEWTKWLKPASISTIALGVRFLEDGLIEFGPAGAPQSHRIDIPRTRPLSLTMEWVEESVRRSQQITLSATGIKRLRKPATEIKLHTSHGKTFLLRDAIGVHIDRPRVRINYSVETHGAQEQRELPFVIGVLGSFGGTGFNRQPGPELRERNFVEVDRQNFEDYMARINPRLGLQVKNDEHGKSGGGTTLVELSFNSMADFEPEALARRLGPGGPLEGLLEGLGELRELAQSSKAWMQALESYFRRISGEDIESYDSLGAELEELLQSPLISDSGDIPNLVGRPELDLRTTLTELGKLPELWQGETMETLDFARVQISAGAAKNIIRNQEFKDLEGYWRGLHRLVINVQTGEQLKIRVLNVSKEELQADLELSKNLTDSALYKSVYESEYGQIRGQPFGLLVGDYEFSAETGDISLLSQLSRIAATALCPFITAAGSRLLGMESWSELTKPRDLRKITQGMEMSDWRNFREQEEARYVALTMPRVLARVPYGNATNPVETFYFEEIPDEAGAHEVEKFCWMSSAYLLAERVAHSFSEVGWFDLIRGMEDGGCVEGLPIHRFPHTDGGRTLTSTEVAITDRREAELSSLGLVPLGGANASADAIFFSAGAVAKPLQYDSAEQTADAVILSRLPCTFATSRFVQYIKVMCRDRLGSFTAEEDLTAMLNKWLSDYVNSDVDASPEMAARYPLLEAGARLLGLKNQGEEGYIDVELLIRPRLRNEELQHPARLVVSIPDWR